MSSSQSILCRVATLSLGVCFPCSAGAALSRLQIDYDTSYTGALSWGGSSQNEGVYLTAFRAMRIGGDALPSPHTDPFYTFCMDISSVLIPTDWWKSGDFSSAGQLNATPYLLGGINRAASLYRTYVAGVDFSDTAHKKEGAALQLALWEVLYEEGGYDVTAGSGFKVAGADSEITQRANAMLASPANFVDLSLTSTFWNATDAGGAPIFNQDLIGPQVPTGFVPEPGTYLAALSALATLVGYRFRRIQKPE